MIVMTMSGSKDLIKGNDVHMKHCNALIEPTQKVRIRRKVQRQITK